VLAANNLVLPAGSLPVTTGGSTISIPVSAQHELILNTKEELLALAVGVKMPAGRFDRDSAPPITLGDLGSVALNPVNPTGYAELNKDPQHGDAGHRSSCPSPKTSDANTVDVVQAVNAKLEQLRSQNNARFEIDVVSGLLDVPSSSRATVSSVRADSAPVRDQSRSSSSWLSLRSTLVAPSASPSRS